MRRIELHRKQIYSLTIQFILAVMLFSTPADGMVYTWKDTAGNTHYANKEYDVPASYKSRAKILYPETTDSIQIQPGNRNEQQSPEVQPPPVASQQPTPQEQQKEKTIVTMPTENRVTPVKAGRRQRRSATEE